MADKRGAEIEMPKASRGKGMGRVCPLPQPTKESGERRKLPQRGPGRPKRVLEYLEVEKIAPDSHKSVIFDIFAAYM